MMNLKAKWAAASVSFVVFYLIWKEVVEFLLPRRPVPVFFFLNMIAFSLAMIWLVRSLGFRFGLPMCAALLPLFFFTRVDHFSYDIGITLAGYFEGLIIAILSAAWLPSLLATIVFWAVRASSESQ